MFKHILIPTDGSELSRAAVAKGITLARSVGARTTIFTASPTFHVVATDPAMVTSTKEQYTKDAEAAARKRLEEAGATAKAQDVPFDLVHVFNDAPYRAIIDTAESRNCDLILMASHGRKGASALLLGSETQKVLAHCKIPVLVWR
jgi:nucleotide-binding universal stress UspA family protein